MVTSFFKKETTLSKQNENVFFLGFLLLKINSTPLFISGDSGLFIDDITEENFQQDTSQSLNNHLDAYLP